MALEKLYSVEEVAEMTAVTTARFAIICEKAF